jgi:hypothetical protein
MKKFFMYLIISIGLVIMFAVSVRIVVTLLILVWAISQLFSRFKRSLDVNGDGSINMDDVTALFSSDRSRNDETDNQQSFLQKRMQILWTRLEHKFVLLSIQVQKRERSSRHWWSRLLPFSNDRKVTGIIENLALELDDKVLSDMRTDFMSSVTKLGKLDGQLAEIHASIAMKSVGPGGAQHKVAAKLEKAVEKEAKLHESLLHAFRSRMMAYGIDLSLEQTKVLLSRVDAGDVSRMTTVFAVISSITAQFADAKVQSSENLDVTKKYYGIYLGLLELQMHIQTEYIEKIDTAYLPGVQQIGNEARDLKSETEVKLKKSENSYQGSYRQNIKSQEFTIEVTDIYANALRADRNKVEEARSIVSKLHELAGNTLSTVRVSADLSALVRQSEGLYKQVMSLQTPALVPFENLQMQREFEAVTQRLKTV